YPKLFKKSILISEKQSIYCGAVKINSYAIDAEGYMYKCWNDIGNKNKSIYRIDNTEDNIMNLVNYLNFNPFKYQDCNNCVALPICVGGCPYNNLRNEKIKCTRYNDLIEKYLDSVQDNYKI
ncbi:MAG: SPASM domain-containing protein, partial [Bacilli bacterium]